MTDIQYLLELETELNQCRVAFQQLAGVVNQLRKDLMKPEPKPLPPVKD